VTLYANAVHKIINADLEAAAKAFNMTADSLWPTDEKISRLLDDGAAIKNLFRNHTYQSTILTTPVLKITK